MLSKFSFWIILLITFIVHGPAVKFSFWKDDWINVWGWINKFSPAYQYWNHPGTAIEFAIFSQIFGAHIVFWQIFGIMLRFLAAISVGKLMLSLTERWEVATVASLFYAVGVAGVDAVGWTSAHVVHLDTIFMCLGFGWLLKHFEGGRSRALGLGLISLLLAFLSDPWRMFPVFLLAGILWWWFDSKRRMSVKMIIRLIIIIMVVLILAAIFMWPGIVGTELFGYIRRNIWTPLLILQKIYVVNNYVQSMVHLWFGWLVGFSDDSGTGVYNGRMFRVGIVFLILATGFIWILHRYNKTAGKRVGFLWLLALVMYLPNWLFEPRLTMAVSHRYMAVSAVGLVGITVYIMSYLQRSVWAVVVGLFILGNLFAVDRYYRDNLRYREDYLVSKFLDTVNIEVGNIDTRTVVFVFMGGGRLRTRNLTYGDALPWAIKYRLQYPQEWPVVTEDVEKVADWLCDKKVRKVFVGKEYEHPERLTVSSVYGWEFTADNQWRSVSEELRERLRGQVKCEVKKI